MLTRSRKTYYATNLMNIRHLSATDTGNYDQMVNVMFCGQNINETRVVRLKELISQEYMPNLQTISIDAKEFLPFIKTILTYHPRKIELMLRNVDRYDLQKLVQKIFLSERKLHL